MTNEMIVLAALESCEMSRAEIRQVTGIRAGALYPALLRLEERGAVVSQWDRRLHPDSRVYRVANEAGADLHERRDQG